MTASWSTIALTAASFTSAASGDRRNRRRKAFLASLFAATAAVAKGSLTPRAVKKKAAQDSRFFACSFFIS
jgi:hypothetical protein